MKIDDILTEYKTNIQNFINLCKNKIVVFDFDGTLTKFKYASNRLLPCKQADIQKYAQSGKNLYQDATTLKTMQYIIKQLDMNNIRVLTTSFPELRSIKSEIIIKNFSIPQEQIIHSNNDLHKVDLLKEIHLQTSKEIIFVEDTIYTLMAAEDNLSFVFGYHISSLLP